MTAKPFTVGEDDFGVTECYFVMTSLHAGYRQLRI